MKKLIFAFLAGILVMTIPTTLAMSRIFSDVPEDAWYSQAASNLKEKDIINGYEDGTYKPEAYVNRAELATIINNVIEEQQEFNRTCDKLAVYKDYYWFDKLEESYASSESYDSMQPDIEIENGEGCLIAESFIFTNGYEHHGFHSLFKYDIKNNKLIVAEESIGNFTGFNSQSRYLSFSTTAAPRCTLIKGKYYFEENRIERTSEILCEDIK